MDIRILPSNIANMIAAGEVVQRPASVVKELMENAVDSGADNIKVIILDAGRTLIQVIDNGCGMTPDEAVICFERHATSKLATADDLHHILTYGFRGEALASIAAVSEVELRTKPQNEDLGCEVLMADSKHISTTPVSCPVGSNFSVRNLFYNVPARRKFLKSDNVEFKHIVEEFIRVALTRIDIAFSLVHNGKDIYWARAVNSLKFRIQDLFSRSVVDELADIDIVTSVAKIYGYIGRPDLARKTLGNQFFFVNKRFCKSPYLHKAVMKAYENLIPEGTTPSYFLNIELNPEAIDVNIHPTKTEIKFEDDSILFQVLFAAVKEALGKNSFGLNIDFDNVEAVNMPVIPNNYTEINHIEQPQIKVDNTYNPFENSSLPCDSVGQKSKAFDYYKVPSDVIDRKEGYGKLFDDNMLESSSIIIIGGKYLITNTISGVLLINIKRARQRIFYERFLKAIRKTSHISQINLFPVQIQVGVEAKILLDENLEILNSLGFDISPFGNDTVVINGVPDGFSSDEDQVKDLIFSILHILNEGVDSLSDIMESALAEKFAEIGARKSFNITSSSQGKKLIDTLYSCENKEYTSTGLKIATIIKIEDLDKLL